jgi:lipopolysaccharide biosynthesis glycosyltransferase
MLLCFREMFPFTIWMQRNMKEPCGSNQTDILICIDDNYAPVANVMLMSLFMSNKGVKFDIYAIVSEVSEKNLGKISNLCRKFSRTINFLDIAKCEYEFFELTNHYSHAAFFRLFAPKMIKADKILYLDVDLIIQIDISPLLRMEIKNSIIAGSLDNNTIAGACDNNSIDQFKDRTGLDADEPYINTGILLMNLKVWREQNITKSLLDHYAKHKNRLMWADQDLLNIVLAGEKKVLEQQWNVLYSDLIYNRINLPDFTPDSFTGIFHYNSSAKPWSNWAIQPYQALYDKYADLLIESSMLRFGRRVLRSTEQLIREVKRNIKSKICKR